MIKNERKGWRTLNLEEEFYKDDERMFIPCYESTYKFL